MTKKGECISFGRTFSVKISVLSRARQPRLSLTYASNQNKLV